MKLPTVLLAAFLTVAGMNAVCATPMESVHAIIALKPIGYWHDVLDDLSDQIRNSLAQKGIELTETTVSTQAVTVAIADKSRMSDAEAILLDLMARNLKVDADRIRDYEIVNIGNSAFAVRPTAQGKENANKMLIEQSVELLRLRLQSLTSQPVTIQGIGSDRIVIDVPGFSDLGRFREFFAPSSKLTLHLVDDAVSDGDIKMRGIPSDDALLGQRSSRPDGVHLLAVKKKALLSGEHIINATNTVEISGRPVVSLGFDHEGTVLLAEITRENVGRRLAIVMGNQVMEAPRIMDPILGGEMEIDGDFTQDSAAALAVLLRGDSVMPASFRIVKAEVTETR